MAVETEAQQAIRAHLVKAPGVTTTGGTGGGWTSSIVVGGGTGADPATIVFQKTRVLPTCQLRQVAFTGHRGLPMELVIRTWQEPDGSWVVAPVGGGSGKGPRRPRPWVNFAAQFGAQAFTAGGNVEGTGSDQASSVRLTFADGLTAEDTVDNGKVLFFEPCQVALPAEVEILDERGGQLAKYTAFDGFSSLP